MNSKRRKEIGECHDALGSIMNKLLNIMTEEEEAFNNLPEGLQQSERGEKMQNAIDTLDSVADSLMSIIEELEEID